MITQKSRNLFLSALVCVFATACPKNNAIPGAVQTTSVFTGGGSIAATCDKHLCGGGDANADQCLAFSSDETAGALTTDENNCLCNGAAPNATWSTSAPCPSTPELTTGYCQVSPTQTIYFYGPGYDSSNSPSACTGAFGGTWVQ